MRCSTAPKEPAVLLVFALPFETSRFALLLRPSRQRKAPSSLGSQEFCTEAAKKMPQFLPNLQLFPAPELSL